jgi:hypothetical protein
MTAPPITMSLMGGLGNQLFQLATGLEVAERAGAPLQLDLSWFDQSLRRAPDGLVLRPYELEGIADDIPKVRPPESRVREFFRHSRDLLVRRSGRLVNRLPVPLLAESGSDFNPCVLKAAPGTHLWGYFSSWRYFPTVADSVRLRVLKSPRISTWAHQLAAEATSSAAVALHVRRGDYLTLASTYGHVSREYYQRALAAIRAMGQSGPIWLFSDDPRGAVQALEGVAIARVIDPPPEASSVDSMLVMSSASTLIVANSTYSWWAAFLQDADNRPVIAPRPMWASSDTADPRDLLPPTWLTLDARSFT